MMKTQLLPDDPRLTAYALGELEGEERAEVELFLHQNPSARSLVTDIRAVVTEVERALERETSAPVVVAPKVDPYSASNKKKLFRFPQYAVLVSGLAAAAFAVVLALQKPPSQVKEPTRHYTAIPMFSPERDMIEPSSVSETTDDETGQVRSAEAPATMVVQEKPFDLKPLGLLEESKKLVELPRSESELYGMVPPLVFSLNYGDSRNWSAEAGRIQELIKNSRDTGGMLARNRSMPAKNDNRFIVARKTQSPNGGTRITSDPLATVVNDEPIVLSRLTVEMPAPLGYFGGRSVSGSRVRDRKYAFRADSEFVNVGENGISTFSADVDTTSYAKIREMLLAGERPPADAVRIEELLNYFPYSYAAPKKGDVPFSTSIEVADAPWAAGHRLVRIGVRARETTLAERGPANLVFLVDVSKSMEEPNKLPLLKRSIARLCNQLRPDDRVSIVTYAGPTGLALPPTAAANKKEIVAALDHLRVEGVSDGKNGIQLAYDLARRNFARGGVNRVILCTDGDFNLGVTGEGGLGRWLEQKADTGVFLTVAALGMGDLKDSAMQQLVARGRGNYAYVNSERDAEKLLVAQVSGAHGAVAKRVNFQVEFNPAKVASYRLIGYEKPARIERAFASEKLDSGDMDAGHAVTALFEIVPITGEVSAKRPESLPPELRYVSFASSPMTMRSTQTKFKGEVLTLKVNYKDSAGFLGKQVEYRMGDNHRSFDEASADMKFTAAVAGFGMILRDSPQKGTTTFADVARWAEAGTQSDPGGYRAEFIALVDRAKKLP